MAQLQWRVLIPFKGGTRAKSRLNSMIPCDKEREALSLRFTLDVVAAAKNSPIVAGVSVVTSGSAVAQIFRRFGTEIIFEKQQLGLTHAVEQAQRVIGNTYPGEGIAVLMGDLPALDSQDLTDSLLQAAQHERAVIPDKEGAGTVLLAAQPGVMCRPSYEKGSFERHVLLGHTPVMVPQHSTIRQDVDSPADLETVLGLGTGKHTQGMLVRQIA